MEMDTAIRQRLKEAGATDDMILQYQRYLDAGDKQGQKRLLCRFRRIQKDGLKRDREKLACLDYIIAKVEKTHELSENDHRPNK